MGRHFLRITKRHGWSKFCIVRMSIKQSLACQTFCEPCDMTNTVPSNGQSGAMIRATFELPMVKSDALGDPGTISHEGKAMIANSSRINKARQQDRRAVGIKIQCYPATLAQVACDSFI